AALEVRQAQVRQPNGRDEQEPDGGLDRLLVELERACARRAARVVDQNVDAAVRLDRHRDDPLRVERRRYVARDCERAQPIGLTLEHVLAPREHDDVRALLDQRFGDAEADSRRGAADDRRAPLQAEVHRFLPYFFLSTPTTSRTAAADSFSQRFSSAVSLSLTISSTPPAPSFAGTPM